MSVPKETLDRAKYLAVDPGETTGWALFDAQGVVLAMGQFKQVEQNKWLQAVVTNNLNMVICEDYRNHGFTQQKKWSRNQTSKNIGSLEMLCDLVGVPITLQPNTVKGIGYLWGGMSEGAPSNHSISHQYDAWAHGIYWLQQNGVRPVGQALLERLKNED